MGGSVPLAAMTSPAPAVTFYRRPLPEELIPFASPQGRVLFQEALAAGGMEGWFALAEQFHTQSDPAFCGLGSLVVVLNALQIDPGRIWKGPWRWYAEEMLDCCKPLEEVRAKGVTLEELCCLARCNGATARPRHADEETLPALRDAIAAAASAPLGPFVVAGYTRHVLGQTGDGHFSPVAGYHAGRDMALLLDVARFKYPPHWVPLPLLFEAMQAIDSVSGRARGWVSLRRNEVPSAIVFRLATSDDAQNMSQGLFENLARRLTGEDFTAKAFVAALDAEMGESLGVWMAKAVECSIRDEHRMAIDELRSALRSTAAYALVRDTSARNTVDFYRDEALAVLLLALPDSLLAALHAPASLSQYRMINSSSNTALAAEVASLREQVATLALWRDRNVGACRTSSWQDRSAMG